MPVDRSTGHAGRVAVVSLVALVILAVGLWFAAAYLTSNPDVELRLGDDEFDAGDAEDIADAIADDDGAPIIYQDPARFRRPIYLQHVGDDPERGWYAFDAVVGDCREALEWTGDGFEDPCTGETYPPDGEGVNQFDVEVTEGDLVVDLTPDG